MSEQDLKTIMSRIKIATIKSPIGVMHCSQTAPVGWLDAYFAATTGGRENRKSKLFIGEYHRGMDLAEVRQELSDASVHSITMHND